MYKKNTLFVVVSIFFVVLLYTAVSVVKFHTANPLSALAIFSKSNNNTNILNKNIQFSEKTITGILEILLAEDLKNRKSWNEYFIRDDKGESKRLVISDTKDLLNFKTGSSITVSGIDTKDGFIVTPETIQGVTNNTQARQGNIFPNDTKGVKKIKVATILFNFTDNPTETFSPGYTKDIIFGNISGVSANEYYKIVSNNKLNLVGKIDPAGDVYGWYTLPVTQAGCSGNFRTTWTSLADQAAAVDGFDSAGYDMVIYNFPAGTVDCAWTGVADAVPVPNTPVSLRRAWLKGTWTPTYVHEIGHLLGLQHANSVSCFDANGQKVSISGDCVSAEYGDPYDTMGGHDGLYINSRNEDYLGSMSPSDIQTVNTTGVYTINALDSVGQRSRGIRIPIQDDLNGTESFYYYLEFRNGTGWDSVINTNAKTGISIRVGVNDYVPQYVSGYNMQDPNSRSYIIDAHPSTVSFVDAPLQTNEIFYDSSRGIRITHMPQIGQGINTKSVKIEFLNGTVDCHLERPTFTLLGAQSLTVNSGDSATLKYTLTNNDSGKNCAPRLFSIEDPYSPYYYLHIQQPPSLGFGESYTGVVIFSTPANAPSQSVNYYMLFKDKNPVLVDGGLYPQRSNNYITITIQSSLQCQVNTPSVQFVYDGIYVIPGVGPSFRYIKTVTNNNTNCVASEFNTSITSINGWRSFTIQNCLFEINPWIRSTYVLPQSSVSSYECFIPPANTAPGSYDFPFSVSDGTMGINWGQIGIFSQTIAGGAINMFDN